MKHNLNKTGLSEETIQKIQSVFLKYPKIDQVLIYGSRAKGNYSRGSDIDLTIPGRKINFSELLKIENELDDLLLPYKIDLSLLRQIENDDLLDHIDRVGFEIYRRNNS